MATTLESANQHGSRELKDNDEIVKIHAALSDLTRQNALATKAIEEIETQMQSRFEPPIVEPPGVEQICPARGWQPHREPTATPAPATGHP